MDINREFNLVATAASGLEALVGKELRDLGIECEVENGRASRIPSGGQIDQIEALQYPRLSGNH